MAKQSTRKVGSRVAPGRVAATEKRRQALHLRAAGADFRSIANSLDISVSTAYKYVWTEMREITRESAEEVLAMDLQRIDQLQASVWAAARSGDLQAVNTALRAIELRQRLFGNLRSGVTVNTSVPPPQPPTTRA